MEDFCGSPRLSQLPLRPLTVATAGPGSAQTPDKHVSLPSNNLKGQRPNHPFNTSFIKNQINNKSPSSQTDSEDNDGANNAASPGWRGRGPGYELPDETSIDIAARRKRPKKLTKKPKSSTSGNTLSPGDVHYKLFGCTCHYPDTGDGKFDDSPCLCQSNALLTPTPPIDNRNVETTDPGLTVPRLSRNGDGQHIHWVDATCTLVGPQSTPGPSGNCPSVSNASHTSDPPTSQSYPADAAATSVSSHPYHPPEPVSGHDACQPLAGAHPSPPTAVETKRRRRDSIRKRFLAILDRFAAGRARHGPRGGGQSKKPRVGRRHIGRNTSKSSADTSNLATIRDARSGAGASGQKRSAIGDDGANTEDEEGGNDDSDRNPHKRSRLDPTPEMRMACPFFKRDPIKHWNCSTFASSNWSHVKQHLERKHYKKFYSCPRCGSRFDRRTACDDHIIDCDVARQERPGTREETGGEIGEDEQRAIDDQIKRKRQICNRDRWNIAWNIFFPGDNPPPIPFARDPRVELREAFLGPVPSQAPSLAGRLINEGLVTPEAACNLDKIIDMVLDQVRAVEIPEEQNGSLADIAPPSQGMEAGNSSIIDAVQHHHLDPIFGNNHPSQGVELEALGFTGSTQDNILGAMPDIYPLWMNTTYGPLPFEDTSQPDLGGDAASERHLRE